MQHEDTIAARATAPGVGGVAIVRVSGGQAKAMLVRVFMPASPRFTHFRPWTLHRGRLLDSASRVLDDVLAVFMPGPHTFTGEDSAEIHCHGGPALVQAALESLLAQGARLAERGEFSLRAFLNGRMDLTQAEAVAEIIAAPTVESLHLTAPKLDGALGRRIAQAREALAGLRVHLCVAVDFPDDEVECLPPAQFAIQVREVICVLDSLMQGYMRTRCWQEGARVVLAGAVNAGKSSLMNALLGHNRALVTHIPGTTRDFLEENLALDGLPVRLTDTAGLRHSHDMVEQLGIARSRERMSTADAVLFVLDGALGAEAAPALDAALNASQDAPSASPVLDVLHAGRPPLILVWNKADIAPVPHIPALWYAAGAECVAVSALHGEGLEILGTTLRTALLRQAGGEPVSGAPNTRQAAALRQARAALDALLEDIAAGLPYDICAVHLDTASAFLGDVTGQDSAAAVLDRVFATFCIGK